MSTLSTPAQQAKSYLTAAKIGSYKKDGEVYDREKLELRPDDPVFMKHEVHKKIEFGKPFLMSVELFKQHFSTMLYPRCVCSCAVRYSMYKEVFFDKNGTSAEHPQLCNYERFGL
jgi:hypothetical protein